MPLSLSPSAINMYEPSNEMSITTACESGSVRCDFKRCRWSWITEPETGWNHHEVDIPDRNSLYITQANVFLDSIEGKTRPLCTLDEGIETLCTNLASLRSVEQGDWQEVVRSPPVV